ncbi:MAG: hypothetical protein MK085_10825, partial [Phycisphaerales bacterium]|nr:hypothetical protein [Phycisphaerales bacterium]
MGWLFDSISMFGQMAERSWRVQNYYGSTTLHPLAVTVLAGVALAVFLAPRRYVIPAILIVLIYISSAQRLVVGEIDFNFVRILCVVGLLRSIMRGELLALRWAWPDALVFFYSLWRLVGAFMRGQGDSYLADTGWAFDQFAAYMIGRIYLRDMISWGVAIRFACLLAIPTAIFFFAEQVTGKNAFFVFGGVPENTLVRMGKMRAQGAFAHAIIAGAFFVSLLPLMVSQWKADANRSRGKMVAVVGSICCIVVIFSANSSTSFG